MRESHIILLVLGIFFCGLGCSKKEIPVKKREYKNAIEKQKKYPNIIVENDKGQSITNLLYEESVKKYGNPISTEEFENAKEGEVFPGIRAGIGKYYPSGIKITIKEAIWNKNDSTEIAVWYVKKHNKWMPFSYFEYEKNTDF